ncbi:MAG TPA: RNA ligase family protein [Acidimicrobiia bacterium]|nr:RNA ligase family protein [Acidimicrobiia bacterium]
MSGEFTAFPKIPRLFRDCTITEKIDGTNAAVVIGDDGSIRAQSRKRFITPEDDNYGFAAWVRDNEDELRALGPGVHFGEWWGQGIQRRYGLNEKRFSLFNIERWGQERPNCCDVVPVLYSGTFDLHHVQWCLDDLKFKGSCAAPGFMDPEGVMIYHHAARLYFKAPFRDEAKGAA